MGIEAVSHHHSWAGLTFRASADATWVALYFSGASGFRVVVGLGVVVVVVEVVVVEVVAVVAFAVGIAACVGSGSKQRSFPGARGLSESLGAVQGVLQAPDAVRLLVMSSSVCRAK